MLEENLHLSVQVFLALHSFFLVFFLLYKHRVGELRSLQFLAGFSLGFWLLPHAKAALPDSAHLLISGWMAL